MTRLSKGHDFVESRATDLCWHDDEMNNRGCGWREKEAFHLR